MREPPPSSSRLRKKSAAFPSRKKLKIICSFNGAFHLRPPYNRLRYIGGDTRVLSLDPNISFSVLCSRISDLCPKLISFSLKYKLPVVSSPLSQWDTPLVSIDSDEDLRYMTDEYDKMELYGKHSRLWLFVCTGNSNPQFHGTLAHKCAKPPVFLGGNHDLAVSHLVHNDALCDRLTKNCAYPSLSDRPTSFVDDKVPNKPTGDVPPRKMVLKQQPLPKQSEGINSIDGVVLGGFGFNNGNGGEGNQKYDRPLIDLACDTKCYDVTLGKTRQESSVDDKKGNTRLIGSENFDNLLQSAVPRSYPLNPRDGNLPVEMNRSMHCLPRQSIPTFHHKIGNATWHSNDLCNSRGVSTCGGLDAKQDLWTTGGHWPHNDLNRENVMPWASGCDSWSHINQLDGSTYSVKSPSAGNGARKQHLYPYQIRNHRNNKIEMGKWNRKSVRLDERLSGGKCYLAHHGAGVPVGNHALMSDDVIGGQASPVGAVETQQDLLTGSDYKIHEAPYQNISENLCGISINNQPSFVQQEVITISNFSGNETVQECDKNMMDRLFNLSLSSSKEVEHPTFSSPAVNDSANLLVKPGLKALDSTDERKLDTGPKANKSNMVASNPFSQTVANTEKDPALGEEIQHNPLSDLINDEMAEMKESDKFSKVIGGISTDLAAIYTHLATRELQTIKNSDLEYMKELGSGAYGTVYHGKWKGSDVAIKKIKQSCFTKGSVKEDKLVADFWKEAHILGQLHHPNIVAFYGVVTEEPVNNLATVTEYMVNGSLKQVLRRKDRTIDRRKRLILAMDAAFGMEYLHTKNIVHFDLKSHNFFVNMKDPQRPVCKIGDLGLSKIKQRTLVSGGVRGTIPWMAPELLNSKNMVTEKVDVYSFGVVMWELLTGEDPYSNLRSEEIIAGIISGTLRPEVPGWCDPAWRSLMERCWSSDPASRPAFSMIATELRAMAAVMNIK